jgi:hypothetical protein
VEYEFNTMGTWVFNGSLMWRAEKVIWWWGIIDITVVDTFSRDGFISAGCVVTGLLRSFLCTNIKIVQHAKSCST